MKKLSVLMLFFFVFGSLEYAVFSMDLNGKNSNGSVDVNDPMIWALLAQSFPSDTNNSLENSVRETSETNDFINSILDDNYFDIKKINRQSENLSSGVANNNAEKLDQDQVDTYSQEHEIIVQTTNKRKLALIQDNFLGNDNKEKKIVSCQLCGKAISSSVKKASLIKRNYINHLIGDIVNLSNRLDKIRCYLCNKVVDKEDRLNGRLYQHLASDHLETVLDQSEQLCGIKITKEEVDTYLQEYGVIVKPKKKRKLDGCTDLLDNNNNEVLSTHNQKEEFANVQEFLNTMDEKLAGPKKALSPEEIEKHLGI